MIGNESPSLWGKLFEGIHWLSLYIICNHSERQSVRTSMLKVMPCHVKPMLFYYIQCLNLWKQLFLRKMCSWQEFIYKENKANSFVILCLQILLFFKSEFLCFFVRTGSFPSFTSSIHPSTLVLHSPTIQEFQIEWAGDGCRSFSAFIWQREALKYSLQSA